MGRVPPTVLYGRPEVASLGAFAEGVTAQGGRVMWQRPGHFRPRDAIGDASAVLVNGLSGTAQSIAETYRAMGVPVWILELPRLREERDAVAVLWDSLHWLPPANGRKAVTSGKIKTTSQRIVVALQKEGDCSHGMGIADISAWVRATVAELRARQALPVAVRRHPQSAMDVPSDAWGADAICGATTIREALADAAEVVTYNSTVGWDAIAAGIPVYAHGPSSYGDYVGPLTAKARTEALSRGAASQWTLDELRDGRAIRATLESVGAVYERV